MTEHADTDATTDTGASGDSAGDVLTFANPVFDAADRTQVATDQGYCIRTVAGSAYECNWTTFLPKGQLVVEGPFYDAKDSTLAITGGTGAYKNARGTMDLHALDGGKRYTFTFRVVGVGGGALGGTASEPRSDRESETAVASPAGPGARPASCMRGTTPYSPWRVKL